MRVAPVPIGELVDVVKSWNPTTRSDDDFLYVDLSAVSQKEKRIVSPSRVLGSEAPSRARQLVKEGDILVSTVRPNLNGVAAVTKEFDGAVASTGFCVLRPKPGKLVSEYLMHWVQSPMFVDDMVREATGASYPAVSDRIVKSSIIPLPPLDEQRRIAAILDKADALRRNRKRALDLLNRLIESIFLEMFGAPNDGKGLFPPQPLGSVAEIVSGAGFPDRFQGRASGDIPFYKVSDMNTPGNEVWMIKANNYIDLSVASQLNAKIHEPGTVVFPKIGAAIATNKKRILSVRSCFDNNVIGVIGDSKNTNNVYLYGLFRQIDISQYAQPGNPPSIRKSTLEESPISLPPLTWQDDYAQRIASVWRQTERIEASREHFDNLFSSLQHRAFTGQL